MYFYLGVELISYLRKVQNKFSTGSIGVIFMALHEIYLFIYLFNNSCRLIQIYITRLKI